jgi:hypothetical protein
MFMGCDAGAGSSCALLAWKNEVLGTTAVVGVVGVVVVVALEAVDGGMDGFAAAVRVGKLRLIIGPNIFRPTRTRARTASTITNILF